MQNIDEVFSILQSYEHLGSRTLTNGTRLTAVCHTLHQKRIFTLFFLN